MNGLTLLEHISVINDPRQDWKVTLSLSDIIFIAIVAVIGGAEGWEEIEYFGNDKREWLEQYTEFEHGIPTHNTIARIMSKINPMQL